MSRSTRRANQLQKEFLRDAGLLEQNPVDQDQGTDNIPLKKQKKTSKQTNKKQCKNVSSTSKKESASEKNSNTATQFNKPKSEGEHQALATTFPESKPEDQNAHVTEENYSLRNHARKAQNIQISEDNIAQGFIGHGSVVLKKPIIEGCYFMEVKVLSDSESPLKLKYQSAVRIGLCPYQYDANKPLGLGESVAYNSATGNITHGNRKIQIEQPFKEGDIVGIAVKIAPPHKHPSPAQIYAGTSVTFFKNGTPVHQPYCKLTQQTYAIGLSLFNFARVEVITTKKEVEINGEQFTSFTLIEKQKIPYSDLQLKCSKIS